MIRCLGNRVLLFPLAPVTQSTGGIQYPEGFGQSVDQQRFWVAAKGPKVVDLEIGDHVVCPMPAEEHVRLPDGARVLDANHVIAKLVNETLP